MDVDRWRRVEQVLDAALAREAAEWPAVLDQACSGDSELRREVQALLDQLGTARRFLESPPAAVAAAVIAEAQESSVTDRDEGRRIGAYRIVRQIGRGGMSRVFLAERADGQFAQQVALKLLRPGLDSEIDQDRFRAERQILASLNHPNIARLLDGGVTDDGLPYLVLEHVDGVPIDRYCDERALSVRERLELFRTVAEAVQYAHRNLVVHRDLKPSNILVAREGAVKLLDFGLATLVRPKMAPPGPPTHAGHRWMTPEYAAPEQIRGEPVTTLTDVYQLGAVLYELLSGRVPFAAGSLHDLEAAVLHEEPEPPSAAVARRDRALTKLLRGDLDAIVLKALRKEPEERFASAAALAEDLRRHLLGDPVLARRQTTGYRARRFVRRHRVETLAALAIAVSLLGGAVLSLSQARRAGAERDRAEAASRESAAVTAFLLGLFEASDPAEARGDALTARGLLRRGVARAEQLRGQPAAQARMLEVTGRVHQSLGQYAEAHALFERALALRWAAGEDGPGVAGTLGYLADARLRLGRYASADSAAREALAIRVRALGPGDPIVAASLHQIASLAIYRGDLAAAEAYHRRGLTVRERALGPEDSLTATSHLVLGSTLRRQGRLAEAEREFRRALAIYERALGPDHPEVANAVIQIAYLLDEDRGRYAEAAPLYRRALEIRRRVFGDGHPMVGYTLSDLGSFLVRRGDFAAAVPLARQQLEIMRRAYGPEHPRAVTAVGMAANTLYGAGELAEAEALFRQAIALERRIRGEDHTNVAGHEMGLARLLIDRGDYAGADSVLRDAIRIYARSCGPTCASTARAEGLRGRLLTRTGDYGAADSLLRLAIRVMERQIGREDRNVRELYGWLADLHDAWGRPDEAARYRAIAAR